MMRGPQTLFLFLYICPSLTHTHITLFITLPWGGVASVVENIDERPRNLSFIVDLIKCKHNIIVSSFTFKNLFHSFLMSSSCLLMLSPHQSILPDSVRKQAKDVGLTWFELECIAFEKEYDGNLKINYVIVFERPGLHKFLSQLSKVADLVLFTEGIEGEVHREVGLPPYILNIPNE
ncbi:unnamed protein product [Lactuca virosa]|uniref:Uncharacterized protein n=1 Tax=Lactuca virosa TaxID=75947 RepID=A0AAU9LIG8_9ASTR|nr:unnamed protein product [Lactuca virosa]